MAGARDELELDLNLDNATAAAAAITAAAATASAQDFFLINGLPTDLLVTIVALAAQQMDKEGPFWQDPSGTIWIRHSFPLVCKRWNAVFATQGRQPFARDAPSRLWEGDQVGEGGGEGVVEFGGGVGGGRAWHAPRPPPRHEGEAESQALLEAFKAKLLARNPNAEVLFH